MIKLFSTVGFIIINEDNKILLVKREKEKKAEENIQENEAILSKEEWMIPFGDMEESDNPRDIIKREVKKCLNCEVENCNYFNLYFYNISDNFIKKASYFFGTIKGEIKTEKGEFLAQWIPLTETDIANLSLMPEQKEALNDFLIFRQNKNNSNKDV